MHVHQLMEKLLSDFLRILEEARRRSTDLDRGEIQALCLKCLSSAGHGASSILFLARPDGALDLELCSGPLACPPDQLRIRLTPSERRQVANQPQLLGQVEAVRRLTAEVLGHENPFVTALVQQHVVSGAMILLPSEEHPLDAEDQGSLLLLASQIGSLLEMTDVLGGVYSSVMIDDLTGLFNHRYLGNRLPQEISRASRHGHPLSLLFCDIDDFKVYNDRFGPLPGDHLLRDVSDFLKSPLQRPDARFFFRASDVPIRYGGEEFIIILPETPKEGALVKAERLRRSVESTPFTGGESQPLGKVTLSIGVATFPEDASDAMSIVNVADQALLRAKEMGKNQVRAV